MQINKVTNQNFNGLNISLKTKMALEKQINNYIHSTNARTNLAQKIQKCINSKLVTLQIKDNGDILIIKRGLGQPIYEDFSKDNIAKKALKALTKALEVK